MLDPPRGPEMLDAVARLLREQLMPLLSGHAAFQARVAANALDLVAREMRLGPGSEAAALERLRALLNKPTADLPSLEAELAAQLRHGETTAATPGLLEHLWATTLDKVAIDQPSYASYRRALEWRERQEHPHPPAAPPPPADDEAPAP